MSQTSDYYKWDWIKPELEIYQRFEVGDAIVCDVHATDDRLL